MVAQFKFASKSFVAMTSIDKKDILNKEEFLIALGNHIKQLRERKGLTAAEFARRTYMERSHIARLEKGKTNPTATTLIQLCMALNMNLNEFFNSFEYYPWSSYKEF